MNDSYIAVLDSGIGGISVLKDLIKSMPNEKYLYLGDNGNAPYGNKTIQELINLSKKNIEIIKHYPVKCLVIGCNTLSVNIIYDITTYSQIPTFGVFPPIDKISSNERTLLLSTLRTANTFTPTEHFHVLGLKNLVFDIENNANKLREINLVKNLDLSDGYFVNKKNFYDTIILGCTHYSFIKNKISDHFCPKKIISGNEFTVNKVKNYLQNTNSLVNYNGFELNFIGSYAGFNKNFFDKSGQKLLKSIKKIKNN